MTMDFSNESDATTAATFFQTTANGNHVSFELRGVTLTEIVRALDEQGLQPECLTVKQPSLDDVFLQVTGESYEGGELRVD